MAAGAGGRVGRTFRETKLTPPRGRAGKLAAPSAVPIHKMSPPNGVFQEDSP